MIVMQTQNILRIITEPIIKMIVIPGITTMIMVTNLDVLIIDRINKINWNIETKVKTPYINKNSDDELYNATHNYIKREEPNTTCYIWSDKQQTRNCLRMRIGNEYLNSEKNKFKTIKIDEKSLSPLN